MTTRGTTPTLLVVIGANGAGKTTWARANRGLLPKPFYNADSIAEGLGDPNDSTLQAKARQIVDAAIDRDLQERRIFGFESTYSGTSRPDIVRRAKDLSYAVHAVFIGTEAYDINMSRVRKRVQDGGHDIPAEEIIRRWLGAQTNLLNTWSCFDTIRIIDNSREEPVTVVRQDGVSLEVASAPPRWVWQLLSQQADVAADRENN